LLDSVLHGPAERADGAAELYFPGNNVLPVAAVNGADGEDDRLEGVEAPALDGLQGGDALGGDEDGVNAQFG